MSVANDFSKMEMPDELKAKSGRNMERTQQSIELCLFNTVSKIYLSTDYICHKIRAVSNMIAKDKDIIF